MQYAVATSCALALTFWYKCGNRVASGGFRTQVSIPNISGQLRDFPVQASVLDSTVGLPTSKLVTAYPRQMISMSHIIPSNHLFVHGTWQWIYEKVIGE